MFFEPFEFGSAMLRIIYERLMEESEALGLEVRVRRLLQRVSTDIRVRTGRDKTAPIFREVDDKWLFTRTYLEEQAAACDAGLTIYPIHLLPDAFANQTRTLLKLILNTDDSALPERAWQIISSYDAAFSEDLKREMLLEGCIIFQK
jgi:hypothetical protein